MASWTSPKTWAVGDVLTASDMNTYVRDNSQIWIPQSATVATSETTASATYTDLATVGPTVTITTGTKAMVLLSAQVSNATAGNGSYMSFVVSGATTVAALDANGMVVVPQNTFATCIARCFVLTGLTAGSNTFTAKYRSPSATTATYVNRDITVIATQ